MASKRYTTRQASIAANISRQRLDQWISRGYFRPSHSPGPGEIREYILDEILELATLAEITRMGVNPVLAASWVHNLIAFKDDDAILVVWQGPIPLIPSTERNSSATAELRTDGVWKRNLPGAPLWYKPDEPPYSADIVRPCELPGMIKDPDKRSILAVNLNHVEKRVLDALEK